MTIWIHGIDPALWDPYFTSVVLLHGLFLVIFLWDLSYLWDLTDQRTYHKRFSDLWNRSFPAAASVFLVGIQSRTSLCNQYNKQHNTTLCTATNVVLFGTNEVLNVIRVIRILDRRENPVVLRGDTRKKTIRYSQRCIDK